VLWDLSSSDQQRFRCQVGHAYSAVHLFHAQDSKLQEQLWSLVRSLREHALLARQIQRSSERYEWAALAQRFVGIAQRSDELASHLLRELAALTSVEARSPSEPRPPSTREGPSPLSRLLASVVPITAEPLTEFRNEPESAEGGGEPVKREE
jgi:hypothetical protein